MGPNIGYRVEATHINFWKEAYVEFNYISIWETLCENDFTLILYKNILIGKMNFLFIKPK